MGFYNSDKYVLATFVDDARGADNWMSEMARKGYKVHHTSTSMALHPEHAYVVSVAVTVVMERDDD